MWNKWWHLRRKESFGVTVSGSIENKWLKISLNVEVTISSSVFGIAHSTYSEETCVTLQSKSRSWSGTKKALRDLAKKKVSLKRKRQIIQKGVFSAPLRSAVVPAIASLMKEKHNTDEGKHNTATTTRQGRDRFGQANEWSSLPHRPLN